jgi:hypothetical protein
VADDLCCPFKVGQRVRLTRVMRRQLENEGGYPPETFLIKRISPPHGVQWTIQVEGRGDFFTDDCFVALED